MLIVFLSLIILIVVAIFMTKSKTNLFMFHLIENVFGGEKKD
jgi:hypothetical protein